MTTQTVTVNASANLSANGSSTATGSISWTAPSLPSGSVITSVTMQVQWSWTGSGNIRTLTVNGTTVPADTLTTVTLPNNVTSPVTATCRGNNKNATGNHFTWSTLTVTYVYNTYESYTITASSNSPEITVTPASQTVLEQSSATVTLSSKDNCTVYDNNVDVTSLLNGLSYTISSVTTDHIITVVYSSSSGGGIIHM